MANENPINPNHAALPYRIAVLIYAYDADGRLLLLHRAKEPNKGFASPPGGKLEMDIGESPAQCAVREISEEMGLTLTVGDLHLLGIVSETAYAGEKHWLMFLYEIKQSIESPAQMVFDEGEFQWHALSEIDELKIPDSDRNIIYPLLKQYHGGFFMVHINCDENGIVGWQVETAIPPQV